MVAFHFPPLAGSSGIQRTLRFAAHLPSFGWQPTVLTAHPRAYERTSDDLMAEVAPDVHVERAFALDTRRHLSLHGRYPTWLASPDRWIAWRWGAALSAGKLIRSRRPDVLWSTYPIATAHVIGADLHRRYGLPWVADFRDPMAQDGYPEDPRIWSAFKSIEERAIRMARWSVFTTRGAARIYEKRYPRFASNIRVLPNGFDEASFATLDATATEPLTPGATTLLHSGIIYQSERDPTCLFEALARLVRARGNGRRPLRVRFRASANDALLHDLSRRHALTEVVEVLPPIDYRAALAEMLRADGLLILQAANCNEQIPAKLYEYLRAGRPLLALTDPAGDTADAVRSAGIDAIARLDSPDEIAAALDKFLDAIEEGRAALPSAAAVARLERREQARDLASLLEEARASAWSQAPDATCPAGTRS
jgi:glycosyltransferase involved in cell wall biosynthesis